MSELAFGVFDLQGKKKCAEGLPLYECVYTYGRLEEAASFVPDPVQREWGDKEHGNLLYPPPTNTGEGQPKTFVSCQKCGRICIVGFQMLGNEVKIGSRVELEYRDPEQPPTISPESSESDRAQLLSRMME